MRPKSEYDPELDRIRKERQMLKLQNEKNMEDLMRAFASKNDQEMRNKITKDKIASEISKLEHEKLSRIELTKKEELERLEADRETIRRREQGLMNEIKELSKRVKEDTVPKDRLINDSNLSYSDIMKKRELEFAKEKASKIGQLRFSFI